MARIESWVYNSNGYEYRRGRQERPAIPDLFALETTAPTALNSGAGVIRPAPTITLVGDQTASTGAPIMDRIIEGNVNITGLGYLENCIVRGRVDGSTGNQRAIINTDNATVPAGGWYDGGDAFVAGVSSRANIRFCTIDPQTPSPWQGGIGNKNFYAYRCKLVRTTDMFAIFATAASGGQTKTRVEGCYATYMVQWAPDPPNGNRPNTHNDIAQFQGNSGGLADSVWLGNWFDARYDPTYGNPVTPRTDFNGITLSPLSSAEWPQQCWIYFRGGWLLGGGQTFNGGTTSNANGGAAVIDTLFERPGTDAQAPTKACVIHSNMSVRTTSDIFYIDNGAVVPVGTS
jgi:hypothetical protein